MVVKHFMLSHRAQTANNKAIYAAAITVAISSAVRAARPAYAARFAADLALVIYTDLWPLAEYIFIAVFSQ